MTWSAWPILNALMGAIAAALLAYKLAVMPGKFTAIERVGMGLWAGGMILTIGPILSVAPTPFEDWSGFLIRLGSAVYLIGRTTRHRYNNWLAIRRARRTARLTALLSERTTMPQLRKALFTTIRPRLKPPGFDDELIRAIDDVLDRMGVARDTVDGPGLGAAGSAAGAAPPVAPPVAGGSGKAGPLSGVADLRRRLGLTASDVFDAAAKAALFARLSNTKAAALTDADFARVAAELGVNEKLIRAVRTVEAPRGPFDDQGRPSILYEKHVFARNSGQRFNASNPTLSAASWQPGTYGPFSVQYDKLAAACALDPDAAFQACSWGAFQVLGENWEICGYASAFDMALALTVSEAAHLDSFVRFVKARHLVDELQRCRPGDAASCVDFVKAYNGPAFARNNYHVNLARAAL